MNPKRNMERGQSLVELAVSLMIVLVLIAGMFDLGFAAFHLISLQDAVQEGAVYGSINPADLAGIRDRVRNSSSAPIDLTTDPNLDEPAITITGGTCAGGGITVSLTYHYQIAMPLLGAILNSQTIPLRASVTNTILQPECP
jgi:hypothetical protein